MTFSDLIEHTIESVEKIEETLTDDETRYHLGMMLLDFTDAARKLAMLGSLIESLKHEKPENIRTILLCEQADQAEAEERIVN